MDEKTLLKDFLLCPVCLETFKDPVSLSCNHSFCSSCILKVWDQDQNKRCLLCKRRSSKDLVVDFALKELSDRYAGRQKADLSEERKEEFEIEQAVNDLKEKLKSDLQSLQDKQAKYKAVEKKYNKVVQHSKKQLVATEKQIKLEFEKLHQFLREEERARLRALMEEEEQKGWTISREMKTIQHQISSLTASISAVEQELQKESVLFLTSYKDTQTTTRAQVTLPDPQLVSGVLIDVAKHLGNLSFRVWEKMKEVVKFTPVILDPNTANCCLSLSDDLTSVRNTGSNKELPDNPERFVHYVEVLGSEGFSSGKHSWEVEVGDHPCWGVGVAKESVDRKKKRTSRQKKRTSKQIWAIQLRDGNVKYSRGRVLPLKRRPQRIRVLLDCDRGEVSFYDLEDMTHIYTDKDTFTEEIYPYFFVMKKDDANNSAISVVVKSLNLESKSSASPQCSSPSPSPKKRVKVESETEFPSIQV